MSRDEVIFILNDLTQFLDVLAVQGLLAEHHLKAVVLCGVVAACDHDRAADIFSSEDGEVGQRCGDHAKREHVDAGGAKAAGEGVKEARAAGAGVHTDGDLRGEVR